MSALQWAWANRLPLEEAVPWTESWRRGLPPRDPVASRRAQPQDWCWKYPDISHRTNTTNPSVAVHWRFPLLGAVSGIMM
jgi:hypothetical protein